MSNCALLISSNSEQLLVESRGRGGYGDGSGGGEHNGDGLRSRGDRLRGGRGDGEGDGLRGEGEDGRGDFEAVVGRADTARMKPPLFVFAFSVENEYEIRSLWG